MNRSVLLIFVFVFLFACGKAHKPVNLFSDDVIAHIADLKDRRSTDSLLLFFSDDDPSYRREAVLAFGSVQDSLAVQGIGELLIGDPDTLVRRAAAFALGQTPSNASARILREAASKEKNPAILDEILEAYGKTATQWSPGVDPSVAPCGMAWSLYRAGLRNVAGREENKLAALLLAADQTTETRLAAAHFFSRSARDIEAYADLISQTALLDPDVNVRMAAASALRKIKTDSALITIGKIIESSDDYRVRINALRCLGDRPFGKTKDLLLDALRAKNVNVGITASEVIRDNAEEPYWIELANRVTNIKNARIQANVYQAILRVKENATVLAEIKDNYRQSTNPYQRAALLSALQASPGSFEFIHAELLHADTPVVRTSAALALVAINSHDRFKPEWKERFAELYEEAVRTGDAAVIGIVATALRDSSLAYKPHIKDISFLRDARSRLSLPRDNEALQPLEAAIAYFEGKPEPVVKNQFNNPIDWELVKTIPADARAVIKTNHGHISIRLLVGEAPGSVANFVRLAHEDYFDNKYFHRVVPNFVVQAGCHRGDGWGSEDYSIRSEFMPRKYATGSVGMASAGKDTEGTQWFITHSPTPHLDGRYTIFAEVESGMAAVDMMEVGDQILDVEIITEAQIK